MNPNPVSDVISFPLQPDSTTVVDWLLTFASVAIAVCAWRTLPAQRNLAQLGGALGADLMSPAAALRGFPRAFL